MANISKLLITALFVLTTDLSFGRVLTGHYAPPVFWNVFDATVNKNQVALKWEVTEYNNKSFYIQHSTNGNAWEDIDSIKSKNSPFSLEEYRYTHIIKQGGRHYYRVKQIDIDQNRTGFSKVLTVIVEKTEQDMEKPGIHFSPNPATDHVRIVNSEGADNFYTSARIFDLSGKLVAEKKLQSHTNTINISELPAGIYFARVACQDGKIFTQKITKQ